MDNSDHKRGDHNKGAGSAGDETVWFSVMCAGFAMLAAYKHPSIGMNFVLLLVLGWAFWSLWKVTADRFD